jgi:integrase
LQDAGCRERADAAPLVRAHWRARRSGACISARATDLPILPELREELDRLPPEQFLFLTSGQGRAYAVESPGNRFRKQCLATGITEGSAHGLRKAGATRLAEAGATEWEIAGFLAHKDTRTAAIHVRKTNRARMASNGMAKSAKILGRKSDPSGRKEGKKTPTSL